MADQLNIFDALVTLDPTLVSTMEAEPAWMWTRCPVCKGHRYQKRVKTPGKCILTPGCPGVVEAYLAVNCEVCGKPVTARRRDADIRFCSKKCEGAS